MVPRTRTLNSFLFVLGSVCWLLFPVSGLAERASAANIPDPDLSSCTFPDRIPAVSQGVAFGGAEEPQVGVELSTR